MKDKRGSTVVELILLLPIILIVTFHFFFQIQRIGEIHKQNYLLAIRTLRFLKNDREEWHLNYHYEKSPLYYAVSTKQKSLTQKVLLRK